MEVLQAEIINLIALILTACIGLVTQKVMSYLKKKGIVTQLQNHKEVTNIVVGAIEQTYKHLHGKEKLNMAKIEIMKIAKSKGIKISEKDLDLLIESSVREMNSVIRKEIK